MFEVMDNEVEAALSFDTDLMSDDVLHAAVVDSAREIDRRTALQAKLVSAWDARRVWAADGSRSAGHRLARETGTSVASGKASVARARKRSTMPMSTEAFDAGKLSTAQFDLIGRANQKHLSEHFQRDEAMLVSAVHGLRHYQAAKFIEYWIYAADPDGTESQARRQLDGRRATCSESFGGGVHLDAEFDAIGGSIFQTELDKIYKELFEADWAEEKLSDPEFRDPTSLKRTPTQRRADALVEMARRSSQVRKGQDHNYGEETTPALITVLVGEKSFERMCELSTGVVVTPGQVAPLLEQSLIERIVFDGPSRVIDVSHKRSFTGALRRAIEVRDLHCQDNSGCDVPAEQCDIDHDHPWSKGGMTEQSNGKAMCPPHNRRKGSGPPRAGPT